jgi:LPXTG-site transpeptidase (sortase) family protein
VKKTFAKIVPRTKKQKLTTLLILSVLSIFGIAAFLLLKEGPAPAQEPLITYSTDTPDESKTNADNYKWNGAPDEPKKIRITKINVDAYVQKAGVDQNKQVAVPDNVHLAGWFSDSQKPGQKGLAIIAGHVSGRTTDGVFKQLGNLAKGDEFEIELGNGDIKRYKVIETNQVKEADSAGILFSQNPKVKSQVNLITCGGQFDDSSDQYEDRIIVSGELQS